jgi:hypothetical protein
MSNDLNVGDFVYVLDSATHSLKPHRIVEKVHTVTLNGDRIHHVLMSVNSKKSKLEECHNPWFKNLQDARMFLLEAAQKLIDVALENAELERNNAFQIDAPHVNAVNPSVQNADNHVIVRLSDGKQAKVNITLPQGFESEDFTH